MLRYKRIIFGLAMLIVIATAVVFVYSQRPLSDREIRQKFDCDRAVLDVRPTDVYCQHPELYREDVKAGHVVGVTQGTDEVSIRGGRPGV